MKEQSIIELRETALTFPEKAKRFIIKTTEDFQQMKDFLQVIKTLRAQIADSCRDRIESAYKAHKAEVAYQRESEKPLVEAEEITKPKVASYLREQEKIRQEALEKKRKEEEAQKKKEEDVLQEAIDLADEGKEEEADKIIESAITEQKEEPKHVPEKIETKGIGIVKRWKFKVVDAKKIPRKYLIINEALIGQVVRALKDKTDIAGIEVYSEDSVSARRF